MEFQKAMQKPNEVPEGYIAWGAVNYWIAEFQVLFMQDTTPADEQNCGEGLHPFPGKPQEPGAKFHPAS